MEIVFEKLGWVLVHSVWQLTICGVLGWACSRIFRSATARYAVLTLLLFAAAALPFVTWQRVSTNPNKMEDSEFTGPSIVAIEGDGVVTEAFFLQKDVPFLVDGPVESYVQIPPIESGTEPSATISWNASVAHAIAPWLPTIVAIWMAGVVIFSVRLILSWLNVWRLQFVGISAVDNSVKAVVQTLKTRLRIRRAIRTLESRLVNSPIVVGCFRATILLPTGLVTGISASQLEAILAHEIAHIRRFDYLANLLQTVIETLFFYHPAVWWLSRRIREERENCCDDFVVNNLNNKADYGRALLAIEEFRTEANATSRLTIGAKGGSLVARVKRLLRDPQSNENSVRGGMAAIVSLTVGLFCASCWLTSDAGARETDAVEKMAESTVEQSTIKQPTIEKFVGQQSKVEQSTEPSDAEKSVLAIEQPVVVPGIDHTAKTQPSKTIKHNEPPKLTGEPTAEESKTENQVATFRGTVVNEAGEPVAGATVIAQRHYFLSLIGDDRPQSINVVKTDSKGRFEIGEPAKPALPILLWAYAKGHGQAVNLVGQYSGVERITNNFENFECAISLPPKTAIFANTVEQRMGINGRQYDDRNPIPGVQVWPVHVLLPEHAQLENEYHFRSALVPPPLREFLHVISDRHAKLQIHSSLPISDFIVERPNAVRHFAHPSPHKPKPASGETAPIDISVDRVARIHGRILGFEKLKTGSLTLKEENPIDVSPDGTFEFETSFGLHKFQATLDASDPFAIRQLTSRSTYCFPNETTNYTFQVVPAATITGRVVMEDGSPVADAEVRISSSPKSDDIRETEWYIGQRYRTASTDERGRYEFFIPPSRSVSVHVNRLSPGFPDQFDPNDVRLPWADSLRDIHCVGGQSCSMPNLVVRPRQTIDGLLTEPDGSPVVGATVHVQRYGYRAKQDVTTTDEAGRFRMSVSPLWVEALNDPENEFSPATLYVRRPSQRFIHAKLINRNSLRYQIPPAVPVDPAKALHDDYITSLLECGVPSLEGKFTPKELSKRLKIQLVRVKFSEDPPAGTTYELNISGVTLFSALESIKKTTGLSYKLGLQKNGYSVGPDGIPRHPLEVTFTPQLQ